MKLVFNDAQQIPIQSVEKGNSWVKIRLIGMERTEILELFQNEEKIKKFNIVDDGEVECFEKYQWESLTEYTGMIYEIVMSSEEETIKDRLEAVEQSTNDLVLMMAEMIGGGEV